MSAVPEQSIVPASRLAQLREAREIIVHEGQALLALARRLDTRFCEAVELLSSCRGSTLVTGVGKAGLIGRKITATLSSTGTRAHFVHPTEALHGDLGCVGPGDVWLMLSNSGETDEICRLLPIVGERGTPVVAITASEQKQKGEKG